MNKHTPTPWAMAYGSVWHVQNDDRQSLGPRIADMARNDDGTMPTERDANAEFICRACNSHDALLTACQAVYNDPYTTCACAEKVRAAIAQATGNELARPEVSENLIDAVDAQRRDDAIRSIGSPQSGQPEYGSEE